MQHEVLHEVLRTLGPFPSIQVVPAAFHDPGEGHEGTDQHELATDPSRQGTASGHLTYHGGPTITSPKVINCYLDDAFAGGSQPDFDAFTKALVENGYLGGLMANYGTASGTFLGSVRLSSGMSGLVLDSRIGQFVDQHFPQYKGSSQTYVALLLPAAIQVQFDGTTDQSCQSFCGYHTISPGGVYYGVICDSTCSGCHGGFSPHDANMMIRSHELAEWVTDPLGTGWYDDATGSENADICAWQRVPWGPAGGDWCVQPVWTNEQGCYTAPYVAPATGGGSGGGGTPQPPPGHFQIAGPASPLWRFLLANPQALSQLDLSGLAPGTNEHNFWDWLKRYGAGAPGSLQGLLDAGWGSWWETQPAMTNGTTAALVTLIARLEAKL